MGAFFTPYLYLYPETWAPTLDCEALSRYIGKLLPSLRVEVRETFLAHYLSKLTPHERACRLEGLAQGFARAKVHNPTRHELNVAPLYGEIAYERRRLEGRNKVFGLLYDGLEVMGLLAEIIAPQECSRKHIHIAFTNQLLGTWEEEDGRYHARVSIYGFPSLISTTGMVEAPAKPREYYFLKQQYTALGMDDAVDTSLKEEFRGQFLKHGDTRLTEVMKGYVMQAIFYHLIGDPFCTDPNCRLYNAHWQEEVLKAQVGGGYEFCPRHQAMLERAVNSGVSKGASSSGG